MSEQKRWLPALVLFAAGMAGAYWAYRKGGWTWASAVGLSAALLALAVLVWPSVSPVGTCTKDEPCPTEWVGAIKAYIPCDLKTHRPAPVDNPKTRPCKVECQPGYAPGIREVDGETVHGCFPAGAAQCNQGEYECAWDPVKLDWKVKYNGSPISNTDLEGKPICGGLATPSGWNKDRAGATLLRRCGDTSWESTTKYTGYVCGGTGDKSYCSVTDAYQCIPCGEGVVCNPADPDSGKYEGAECAVGRPCALYCQSPNDLGACMKPGNCNVNSADCYYPCLPNGKGYSDTSVPRSCLQGPRCLAYCLYTENTEVKCLNGPHNWYWPYQAFFFMEDGSLRWLSVTGRPSDIKSVECRPIVKWDEQFTKRHLSRLILPVSGNWTQLDGEYQAANGSGRTLVITSVGELKPTYQAAGRGSFVLNIGGLRPYPASNPWFTVENANLVVHDNLYGEEAIMTICQYPSDFYGPPLVSGWVFSGANAFRARPIPDSMINRVPSFF